MSKTTLEMARESGLIYRTNGLWWMDAGELGDELKRFEALVRADERSVEREACAKLIETTELGGISNEPKLQNFIAALLFGYAQAIRARGNT